MCGTDHNLGPHLFSKVLHSLEDSVKSSVEAGAAAAHGLGVAEQQLEVVGTGQVNLALKQAK